MSFDLFISYAEADRAWVEGYLLDALTQAGVRCQTEAAFALGVPRLLEFERAINDSQRTLLILSPAYLVDGLSQFTDLLAQSYGLETATWPVIPLILQPVKLPPRLAMLTALDATGSANWPSLVERLTAELQRPKPGPAARPLCPYPGMVPFGESDRARFFGRDREIQELVERLRLHPFVTVIGPSGSGKSSLVFAGLLPALRASGLFGPGEWLVRSLRPGQAPLAALADVLGGGVADPAQAVSTLLKAQPNAQRLLLIVDQFEELFTVARHDAVPFQQALLQLIQVTNCHLVLTVRADFYPDLMSTLLWKEIQAHRLEVVPLDADGLRQAIVKPAEDVGVFVESALVERLIADAAKEPGMLPLVQETLVLLWERVERRFLPLSAYEALVLPRSAYGASGGVERTGLQMAMARRADAALAMLSLQQQAIARRIFLRLVQFGEGRADTRRQQPITALRSAGDDPAMFEQALRCLTDNRLLTLSGEEGGAGGQVDIAHEALIAGWPTLHQWLTERRAAEQMRRRLELKSAEWVRLGKGSGGLLDQVELLEAERWLSSSDAAELGRDEALPALVEASRAAIEKAEREKEAARQRELAQAQALAAEQRRVAEEQRRRAEEQARATRWLRSLGIVLAVVAVLAVGAAIYARLQTVESQRLRLVSVAQALAAQAARQHQELRQDERSALMARQAFLFNQRNRGPAANLIRIDDALRTALGADYFSHILSGHEGQVNAAVFSPDGQILASAGQDGTVRLWNLRQPGGAPIILRGHEGAVLSVAFSPDGQSLASAGVDKTVRLWNAHQPAAVPVVLRGQAGAVTAVAFSPNGQALVSGGDDKTLRLWNLRQPNAEPTVLTGHEGGITSVTFSPDGQSLASSSDDKTVRLWNLRQASSMVIGVHPDKVYAVAFHPDGLRLASASNDNAVRLWDVRQPNAEPVILGGHTEKVMTVAFSPDGRMLASASWDRTVQLWDVRQPEAMPAVLRGHEGGITWLAFSPDVKTLASASEDGTVRLWDVRLSGASRTVLPGGGGPVSSVAFSRDGLRLASVTYGGFLRLWDLSQPSTEPVFHRDLQIRINAVAFSPDSRTLALGVEDGTVQLWDVRQPGAEPTILRDHEGPVLSVAFSPDGRVLASGGSDRAVRLWDLTRLDARPIILSGHEGAVMAVAASPDAQTLASASSDRTVRLWNWRQPDVEPTVLRGHTQEVWSIAFSPDGQTLASGSDELVVRLWNVRQPSAQPTLLRGHADGVQSLAFSMDGQRLASGSYDGTVRLWNLRQPGDDPIVLRANQGKINSVAFSPDGARLAAATDDQTISIWATHTEDLAQLVCGQVWRNLTPDEWRQFIGEGIPYERTCSALPSGQVPAVKR